MSKIIDHEPSLRESLGLGPVDQPPKTWTLWELDALCSADEDGRMGPDFWTYGNDFFATMSHLIGLQMKGLAKRRDGHKGGPWMITEVGREYLQQVVHERASESNRKDGSSPKNTEANNA